MVYILVSSTCDYLDFQCNDGQCVNYMDRCDNKFDCIDGSDENDCGKVKYLILKKIQYKK